MWNNTLEMIQDKPVLGSEPDHTNTIIKQQLNKWLAWWVH